jgi:hypothetical protein
MMSVPLLDSDFFLLYLNADQLAVIHLRSFIIFKDHYREYRKMEG